MHSRDLRKTMSVDKITLVPVWDELPHLFSDQERAALAWAEEVTNVSQTHTSDEAYAAAAAAFEPKDLVDLTIMIAAMNAFNRLDGAGLAYVTPWLAADALANGRLRQVLEDSTPPYPGLCLYYPRHRHLGLGLRAFLDFLKLRSLERTALDGIEPRAP